MSTELLLGTAGIAGTIIAGIAGALIGARTSRGIEERNARREEARRRAEERAAAAFVRADIEACRRRLRQAMEEGEWWPFYELPTNAWVRHGPTLAPRLPPNDIATIAHAMARLREITGAMATLPERRAGVLANGAVLPIKLDDAQTLRVKLKDVVALTSESLTILEQFAPHWP